MTDFYSQNRCVCSTRSHGPLLCAFCLSFHFKIVDNITFRHFLRTPTNNTFLLEEVDENTILNIINGLTSTTSCDGDNLSTKHIKTLRNNLLKPLAMIINQIFNTGIFPDELKIAKVIPIFKKGDKSDINNFRPISILPVIVDWAAANHADGAPLVDRAAVNLVDGAPLVDRAAVNLADDAPLVDRAAVNLVDGAPLVDRAAVNLADGAPLVDLTAVNLADGAPLVDLTAVNLADGAPLVDLTAVNLADGAPLVGRAAELCTC